jgi:outer membrane protein assembly factor BamB
MIPGISNFLKAATYTVLILFFVSCKKPKPGVTTPPPPPKSSEKSITSFIFKQANNTVLDGDYTGSINGDTIHIQFYQGTNLSGLVPTLIHTGVNIVPGGATAQNFNSLVNYTVTAEDGTTKKYTVKVTTLKSQGTVYVGSDDGNLYAINANTGAQKWKFNTGEAIQSSPTVAGNTVYFGSNDKYLYAVDAVSGVLKWKFLTKEPIEYRSPVVSNGTVYISTSNFPAYGGVYAINAATGILKWNVPFYIASSPTVYNGKVYAAGMNSPVTALDAATGQTIWKYDVGISKANIAINNGKLYVGGEFEFGCLNADNGLFIWRHWIFAANFTSSPTIDNQTLYVGGIAPVDGKRLLVAIDANTGITKWQYGTPNTHFDNTFTSPVVSNGIVYAGNRDGYTYALNASNGSVIWTFKHMRYGNSLTLPQATIANGIVYIGSDDGYLYALDSKTGSVKWKFTATASISSGPCVVDYDGNVFHAGPSGAMN